MSEIGNVNASNFGYYVKNQPSFGRQQEVDYKYDLEEGYDSFERSDKKSTGEKVAITSAIVVPITAATLWLTKGKGWAKLKDLFKFNSKLNNKQNDLEKDLNRRANKILQKHKENKVEMGISREEAQRKVDQAIQGIELPEKSDPVRVINNVETANTNSASRNLVEQARRDTPTPAQMEQYNRDFGYVAPTKEEKQVIRRNNAEANKESAIARQVQNNIPQEQADALRKAAQEAGSVIKKSGTFKTKDGITITLKDGNITEIILADGRRITKPKTLYKYQDKVDLANLEAVK